MTTSTPARFAVVFLLVATALGCNERSRSAPASPAPKMALSNSTSPKAPKPEPQPDLTPEETRVIVHKGTEPPFTGKYVHHKADGTYACRRCGAPLFSSTAKFESATGWPSFDEALPGRVEEIPDADGLRTEIVCARCGAHLGHVFKGEGFTDKGVRHCVNSVSLSFAETGSEAKAQAGASTAEAPSTPRKAYFAGGCFWGVEYYFERAPGVLDVTSGYMGGSTASPSYEQVSSKTTGHAETVQVTYDPSLTSFQELAKLFFEIHDPTQIDRQGPDVGPQYRSAVFTTSEEEKHIAGELIAELERNGLNVATLVQAAGPFWEAEDYHQDYYERTGKQPYCHTRVQRFKR